MFTLLLLLWVKDDNISCTAAEISETPYSFHTQPLILILSATGRKCKLHSVSTVFTLIDNNDCFCLQNYWGGLMEHNKQRMLLILLFETFENHSWYLYFKCPLYNVHIETDWRHQNAFLRYIFHVLNINYKWKLCPVWLLSCSSASHRQAALV